MLLEGRQAADSGIDVVIGYLEPHDRKDTLRSPRDSRRCLAGVSSTRELARGDGHGCRAQARKPELL